MMDSHANAQDVQAGAGAASQPAPIFAYTKFQPPRPPAYIVARDDLVRRVGEAVLQQRLTLVSAAAGSGKSVLLSALAQGAITSAVASKLAAAWITLDEADADLAMFVALLVNATRQWLDDEGQAILGYLQAVPALDDKVAQVVNLFINYWMVDEERPLVIVLDDYHNVDAPAIHHFMSHMVDYLPPGVRVVISTRYDPPLPLARWRMRGQLAEVRQADLLFSTADAATFLNQRHALGLDEATITTLQQQTAGWIAGLQLLTTVLAALPDAMARREYVGRVGSQARPVFELLAEEVWGLQAADVQEFLLQSAVLPELTVASCRAVTQDEAAPQLLAQVFRQNLFLRALGDTRNDGPFRYHDLFRDFLRHKLQTERPAEWRALNLRAVTVAVSDEQKLLHLQRAEAWEAVADLLEEMGQTDTMRRISRQIVIQSIEALPREVRQHRPWLHLFVAQYYSLRGQIEAARPWLVHAAAEFRAQGDEMGEVEILTARAMTSSTDVAEIVAGFEAKIATVGAQFRPDHWVVYRGICQFVTLAVSDWPGTTEIVQTNQREALQSGDPGAIMLATYLTIPQVLFSDAGLASHADFARRVAGMVDEHDWLWRISTEALLAFVHFFEAHVDAASIRIHAAFDLLQEIGGYAYIDDHVAWLMLVLHQLRGDRRGFDAIYASVAERWQTQESSRDYLHGFKYMYGRELLLRGDVAGAQAMVAEIVEPVLAEAESEFVQTCRSLLTGLVAMAQGDWGQAEEALREAVERHQRVRHTFVLNHPRLALATCFGRQRRWSEAMREVRLVVEEVRGRGMPGVILQEGASIVPLLEEAVRRGVEREYLAPLLPMLQVEMAPATITLPDSDEYLTAREGEVLRLLATGVTNPTIAETLTITERTVKAHVTRILAKLDVTTRTEAVMKANQLGLL